MTPKQEAQEAHKIAVLFELLADATEKLTPNSPVAIDIKKKALEIVPLANTFVDAVFSFKSISSSTYFTDLSKKVDTVIRKNFDEKIK